MPDARMVIGLDGPIGTINPHLYDHFAEHLGACIYGGCWLGGAKGLNQRVIEALRRVRPPVIRWPGGCFADDYHWEGAVGPRESRPRSGDIDWGNVGGDDPLGR